MMRRPRPHRQRGSTMLISRIDLRCGKYLSRDVFWPFRSISNPGAIFFISRSPCSWKMFERPAPSPVSHRLTGKGSTDPEISQMPKFQVRPHGHRTPDGEDDSQRGARVLSVCGMPVVRGFHLLGGQVWRERGQPALLLRASGARGHHRRARGTARHHLVQVRDRLLHFPVLHREELLRSRPLQASDLSAVSGLVHGICGLAEPSWEEGGGGGGRGKEKEGRG